ncbi:MAG: double zinc ribbon domain-containing protein [Candidatus Bathyanammoxibius sp.]
MRGPKCRTENPEGSSFCRECGAGVAEDVAPGCPACGTELPVGARFCNKCGHALAEPTPTATGPPLSEPTSLVSGRYQVKQFLGEGGKSVAHIP